MPNPSATSDSPAPAWVRPTPQNGAVSPASGCGIKVIESDGMRRLIAQRAFAAGEQILEVHGVLVSTPSRYTIQVGQSEHVAPSNDPVADQPNLDPWCYLNHSCDPNARLIGRKLVAIRSIQTTEELTFDYNSNEYEMAEPFICRCAACGGSEIRGYRFLSPPKQQELRPHLAEHLLRSGRGDGVV